MKFCVKCGAEFPEGGVAFCPQCGTVVPQKSTASGGKSAKSAAAPPAPGPSVAPAAPPPVQPSQLKQTSPRGRTAALWVAWSLVALLAAGNIFQGLYFGLFRDDAKTTVSTEVITTPDTVSATVPTTPVTVSAETPDMQDATAQWLLQNAMTAIESAYIDLRTFDVATLTPAYLQPIEPSITFVPIFDPNDDSALPLASDDAVAYYGLEQVCGVFTTSASGTVFGIVVDHSAGPAVYTYWVNGVQEDW